jgi:hypothetical protein
MPGESQIAMENQHHSVASDYLRGAMIQFAMRKAADLAGESFYHGLGLESPGSDDLLIFAEDAWRKYSLTIDFDYPHYAHQLFLRAFQAAYLAYMRELPNGVHPSLPDLLSAFETEIGLQTSDRS